MNTAGHNNSNNAANAILELIRYDSSLMWCCWQLWPHKHIWPAGGIDSIAQRRGTAPGSAPSLALDSSVGPGRSSELGSTVALALAQPLAQAVPVEVSELLLKVNLARVSRSRAFSCSSCAQLLLLASPLRCTAMACSCDALSCYITAEGRGCTPLPLPACP